MSLPCEQTFGLTVGATSVIDGIESLRLKAVSSARTQYLMGGVFPVDILSYQIGRALFDEVTSCLSSADYHLWFLLFFLMLHKIQLKVESVGFRFVQFMDFYSFYLYCIIFCQSVMCSRDIYGQRQCVFLSQLQSL